MEEPPVDDEHLIEQVHRYLQRLNSSKPWLLIYDGVEEEINLPEKVNLLITTRHPDIFTTPTKMIQVLPLSEESA